MINKYFLLFYLLMILSGIAGSILYIISCMPDTMEKRTGIYYYDKCTSLRYYSSLVLSLCFIYYFCYNLPILRSSTSLDSFNWNYFISFTIAVILFIPGIIIFINSRKILGNESTSPKKYHKVISSGIYGYIRHPQLFAEILFWLSLSCFMNAPILLLTTVFFWIPMYVIWCKFEEKDLILRFGADYIEYKKNTKFLIPFIL